MMAREEQPAPVKKRTLAEKGFLIGAAFGLVLGVVQGFIVDDVAWFTWLVIVLSSFAGALLGAIIGAIIGGSFSWLRGESTTADKGFLIGAVFGLIVVSINIYYWEIFSFSWEYLVVDAFALSFTGLVFGVCGGVSGGIVGWYRGGK